MPRIQIKKVGNSAALLLTEEIMKLLAIQIGDEVDIRVKDRKLIIQPSDDILREQKLLDVTSNVFERRKSAYQQLAKGVS
jgi:antitoxin component of MazEF toxin-antitoxin module